MERTGNYLLGVDGGNTKTLHFLYDVEGNFVDRLDAGTCSHEAIGDGYEGAFRELNGQIATLLSRNGLSASDVAYAVFGLAGADFPHQKQKLSALVERIGFRRYLVDNDGFLGLKAGSPNGIGVCCINGTGTVTVGINALGERLQLGGLGGLSSDKAGAGYIAERGAAAIYDMLFRGGRETVLKELFFRAFSVKKEEDFPLTAVEALGDKEGVLRVNKLMEEAAERGDAVVSALLSEVGAGLGATVRGCAARLNMSGEVPVVLAGSVWTKGNFREMELAFCSELEKDDARQYRCTILKQPPAMGAVVWAMEEYRAYMERTYSAAYSGAAFERLKYSGY